MRRISLLLAFAAILLSGLVFFTWKARFDAEKHRHSHPMPKVQISEEALGQSWLYNKDDPQTNRRVYSVTAKSFRATHDPAIFELNGIALKGFDKKGKDYTYVQADKATFNEWTGVLVSTGPVNIIMRIPDDKEPTDKAEIAKLVQVHTSGVTYETKTMKAHSDQPASFVFPDGTGSATGVEYDPNTKSMHLKSNVVLDRSGMHVEAGDLVYDEAQAKIRLSPWSKLQRKTTSVKAGESLVTLVNQKLRQIDSVNASGTDDKEDRHVDYSADRVTTIFDADGNLTEIVGEQNARVASTGTSSRTFLTGDRADLHFSLEKSVKNGKEVVDSNLGNVTTQGHAVAISEPLPQPGVQLADTRILRSEHIDLVMKPDGKQVQEISTPGKAQLEFKPNRPEQSHRILDTARLRIVYGEHSYIDTFSGWSVSTHTDKPPVKNKPSALAYTWSDEMLAKFVPNSSDIATIDQKGNFRYQEGTRKASSKQAHLDQKQNLITLTDHAKVLDDTGSATGDVIVMNQASGDMDARGHVLSTHAPDKNEKPGTSMLDPAQTMQAKADQMETRDNNTRVFYEGHVVMWQGANRISADTIDIDRDAQSLHAAGNVVSELVDNKSTGDEAKKPAANATAQSAADPQSPIYTIVKAPDLVYHDDIRQALYTGGATLTRNRMVITCDHITAFLNPKTSDNSGDSSLDHAFADGAVTVTDQITYNRKRTGSSEHGEYYTKDDKVILNGGSPQINDSYKGTTSGEQITYFSGEDHLMVDGESKKVAFTQMKRK
jgi:lipopolysaccharide export system protein LptA